MVDHTNYHDQFMLPNNAAVDLGGFSSIPAFSINHTFSLIYPTVGNYELSWINDSIASNLSSGW